jgi:flagellar hook-associated protein 1 FlgK
VSDFAALSFGLTGITAARKGLDVTGQNIANADTDGYTRQRTVQDALGAPVTPALWSTYSGPGAGVQVTGITRLNDEFLTSRARSERTDLADLTQRQATMTGIEQTFNEPSDTGLAAQLTDMWNAWHDVANQPGDLSARSVALSRTATVADGIRTAHDALDAQWSAGRGQLDVTVAGINQAAAGVAELNQAILSADQSNLPANELRDQRDNLLATLAATVGTTTRAEADGTVAVNLGGVALVRGNTSTTLAVTGAVTLSSMLAGSAPAPAITTAAGAPVTTGGEVGARVDALVTTIPAYVNRLDAFTAGLRDAVNTAQTAGYDLNGNAGAAMFAANATSADITVQLTDPRTLAASAQAPNPNPSLDGSNAATMAALGQGSSAPDAVYRQLVVDVGSAAQTATRRHDIQARVSETADAAADSAGGVNTDEEMVNLLSYQRAYQAAARTITAVDETLDTLINHTGLVGR